MKPGITRKENIPDEEVICGWMEKRPPDGKGEKVETADARWWGYNYQLKPKDSGVGREFHWQWHPVSLTLDRIWEVEEKLSPNQQWGYWHELIKGGPPELGYWRMLHASAATRIAALAGLIRSAS